MKKWGIVIGIGLLLAACQYTRPVERMDLMDDKEIAQFTWDDFQIFEENLIPPADSVLSELTDAPYYLLDIKLDEDLTFVTGTLAVRYTNTSMDELNVLAFQLFPVVYGGTVDIGDVTVDQLPVKVEKIENGIVANVVLNQPLSTGDSCVVRMPFESSIPRDMGGNYGLYGYFDDVLVLDGFYPLLAIYDGGEWHLNITSPNGDIKYEQMSFYQVSAEMPANLHLVSTGQITTQKKSGAMQTVKFIAGPVREFYLAASENFVTREKQVGDVLVLSTGLAGSEDAIDYALEVGEVALNSYSTRFVAYPYRELDVVSTPMQALGMEYPGVSTITIGFYDLNGSMLGTPNRVYLDSVIAHEVGHQWFFNLVGNDQIEEPWLDEAITQYIVRLFYEDYYGESAAQSYKASWDTRWGRVDFAEIPIGQPSYAYDPAAYSPIVYGRGPYFIEALEDRMGKEIFAVALMDYVRTYEWRIATGKAFKQHMETACVCDLDDLFAAWVNP